MLPRKKLIPLKAEFPRIRDQGKRYDSSSFGLMVSYKREVRGERLEVSTPRVAFIVSKKIDRRSVIRHDVKRKLSDAVAVFIARLPKNLELVFLPKSQVTASSREDLKKELETVLKRAGLLS